MDIKTNLFQVRVTPKASANKILVDELPKGKILIRVYVTDPPEGGKANKAVIDLLAKELKLPKSSLTITKGLKSRIKTIMIKK